MTSEADDPPIAYIARTHAWYGALGYDNPYQYAQFEDVPFAPLGRPLAAATLALITTAAPYRPELGDQGPGAAYNAAAPQLGLPAIPAEILDFGTVAGNAVLGVGVANKFVKAA